MTITNSIKPLILLFLIWTSTLFPAQGLNLNLNLDLNLDLNAYTIQFSSKELSLKQALDELFLHKEFNIVYGGKEIDIDVPIVFSSRTLKLKEALSQIEKQAPVEFIIDNNHIIVKKRKLETSYVISGRVVDAATHEGLVAANVFIVGTTTGAVTDAEGNFSMRLSPNNYQLIFRYVGYVEQNMQVSLFQDVQLKTVMEVKDNQLQPVNVQGSFKMIENLEIGRTIETISSKVIDRLNTNDVNDALHGRINGVWNTKVSGAPGDHHKIRIRGISSIIGSTDPIYVVDGTIIPIVNFDNLGIADLNTHDIESITVLKDASSTAIYGNLGGNGVILIETKKGGGEPNFNFSYKNGIQSFNKRYDFMGAEDFLNNLKQSDKLINTQFYYRSLSTHQFEKYPTYYDKMGNALREGDYQDSLFQYGRVNEYQLSGSGSNKGFNYYISGNYYDHNGVVENSSYKKYTLTANISKELTPKFTVRILYKGSHQENRNNLDDFLGNSVILKGINYEPAYSATPDSFFLKPNRLYFNEYENPSLLLLASYKISPQMLFYERNKSKFDDSNNLVLQGYYHFQKDLTFRAIASVTKRDQNYASEVQRSYTKSSFVSDNYAKVKKYLYSSESYLYFSQQYDLNYSKKIKNHLVNGTLLVRNYNDMVKWNVDSLKNVNLNTINPEDDIFMRGSQAIYSDSGSVVRRINSFIANLNYNYHNKYFISLASNYEQLHEATYVSEAHLFKSAAFNWNLANEEWLNWPKWVSAFNWFMNWGETGNYPLNSLSEDLYTSKLTYVVNDKKENGISITNLANRHLRNEKLVEFDFGTSLSLINDRVVFEAVYYHKTNSDLLLNRSIPLYYGGGEIIYNVGEMKNKGLELSLDLTPIDNSRSYLNTRFGFSTNNQVITKLSEGTPIPFKNADVLIPDFEARENEVLGGIIGYKLVGKWTDIVQEYDENKHPKYINDAGLAYLRNDSLNPKTISEQDKMVLGKAVPDFTMNWLTNFQYKNFEAEMHWYGVIGVDKYNATKASTYITGLNSDVARIVADTMRYLSSNVFYESSFFVEDASFVRLKTLRFTYHQPQKILGKVAINYSVSFENMVTITRYSGYDPEATIYTKNNFSDNAIDKGSYPNPMGVYFSINLNFK